jgi:hypothetical protein
MNQYKQSFIYYRLPEEGPLGAKHVEEKGKKESRNRPDVAQSVPGGLGSQISPAAFTPKKCSWYSFSLGAGKM